MVIGTGAQGRMQLRALHCVFSDADIHVADCFPEAANVFAENMSAELDVTVQPAADIRAAVAGADINFSI